MKLYFIKHSCFLIETETAQFLLDYYEGDLPVIDRQKPLFVLASHSHGDHFSERVFTAVESFEDVRFVLSEDIPAYAVPENRRAQAYFIAPHETYTQGGVEISTLLSTDLGVAFLIKTDGHTIYHAGDLNSWVWEGASVHQNQQMLAAYTREIEKLKGEKIHLAFVPLDPRQDEDFSLGMQIFIEKVNPEKVVPMHMWGDFSVVPRFRQKFPVYADKLLAIQAEGDSFEL